MLIDISFYGDMLPADVSVDYTDISERKLLTLIYLA